MMQSMQPPPGKLDFGSPKATGGHTTPPWGTNPNNYATMSMIATQRAGEVKAMQEMQAQMSCLVEMSVRSAEQNKILQVQLEEQAKLLSATMQAVHQVQSQVTGMRSEMMDGFRGQGAGFEPQAHSQRRLDERRGGGCGSFSAATSEKKVESATARRGDSPSEEKALSPPASHLTPPLTMLQAPSAATGGLGVFATETSTEEDPSQAHLPTTNLFNRSPPGLSRTPPGRTPSQERDEVAHFNELINLIVSGDESYLAIINHANPQVLNKTDPDGMSALHYAAMHGRSKACGAILSHKGFHSTKLGDRNSNTALHIGALHDQGDVCQAIMRHDGSAASVVNHFGDSPSEIARRRHNSCVCAAFPDLKANGPYAGMPVCSVAPL